jgi:hypothetical protein
MKEYERLFYLAAMTALVVLMCLQCDREARNNNIDLSNMEQILTKKLNFIILKSKQTAQQLEILFPKLDSIAKANDIPTNHLTNVNHTHVHTYLGDTIITQLDSTNWITGIDTNCLYATIQVDPIKQQVSWLGIGYVNDITTFNYKERNQWFNTWGPKWWPAKFNYFQKKISKCDSVNVQQIFFE